MRERPEPFHPGTTVRLGVIGGGAWGTALALHAARCGHRVTQWIREADVVEGIRERGDNPRFLPGFPYPQELAVTDRLADACDAAELLVAAVPSQYARAVYAELAPQVESRAPVVVASKGIEEDSLELPLDVAREALGPAQPLAVLSGPSFARELAAGQATAVAVASGDEGLARNVQNILSSTVLRLYTNPDPIGVQVAGALKNVIAIAAGIADSLELGSNTQAALITRGLAEIARLGVRLGGDAATFSGLAGLGDLVLTCTGELSRNRTVGRRLGAGERLDDILDASPAVPEGVRTTRSARSLAVREGVDMPIVCEVYGIIYEDGSPAESLARLMRRELKTEEASGKP
ncbi:MAG: NAD(P)-dependent glycerol-3-phosphate dehydrogenase [bacterium]|nr:NAD(P)-dependent glycerol-3-phosphate dehydrogenase [bacterium]